MNLDLSTCLGRRGALCGPASSNALLVTVARGACRASIDAANLYSRSLSIDIYRDIRAARESETVRPAAFRSDVQVELVPGQRMGPVTLDRGQY